MNNKQKHHSTLFEFCIQYLCANARHFTQRDSTETLTKSLVINKHQEHKKLVQQDLEWTSLHNIPSKPSQVLINTLCQMQMLSFPLLLQLSQSGISYLNLSMNGRVQNEWMLLLRDMNISHLNLSHCMVSNEAFQYLKKKPSGIKKRRSLNSKESLPERNQQNVGQRRKSKSKNSPQKRLSNSNGGGDIQESTDDLSKPNTTHDTTTKRENKTRIEPFNLCNSLTSLNLSYNHVIGCDAISTVGSCIPGLKVLSVEGCTQFNNKCLELIGKKMKAISALNMRRIGKISSHGLKSLQKLKKLEVLNISECEKINAEALKTISECFPNLIYLNLRGNYRIHESGLRFLSKLENLKTLDMLGVSTLTSLDFAATLTNLTSLNISETKCTESGIKSLSALKDLKCLNMSSCKNITTQAMITALPSLKQLSLLDISNTAVTDDIMKLLTGKDNLQKLNISYCNNLTDEAFYCLSHLTLLNELYVRSLSQITAVGWGAIIAKLINLTVLDISECFPKTLRNTGREQVLRGISNLLNLTTLLTQGCTLLDDSFFKKIRKLKNMTYLDISNCSISNNGMKYFSHLPSLTSLTMREESLVTSGVVYLKDCTSLEYLDISSSKISNDDFKQLFPTLCNLTNLSLMNCTSLTPSILKYLKNCGRLISLNLYGIPMNDIGISYIKNLKNLNVLRISDSDLISQQAYHSLHDLENMVYLKQRRMNLFTQQ